MPKYFAAAHCLVLASAMILAGCVSSTTSKPKAPEFSFTASNHPDFAVAYYPYGVCMPRHLAAPVPNYTNWTNDRMVRDLRRFQEAGFSTVFVCLDTDRANDDFGFERTLQFIEEAENLGGPTIALLIGPGESALRRDVIARRLVRVRINGAKHFMKEAERPVVYLRPGTDVMGISHPAIMFQTIVPKEYTWVEAGRVNGRELVRDGGNTLRHGIWAAYKAKAQNIVLTWNNFQNGDFIEPNSEDSTVAFDIAKEEIQRVRAAVGSAQTAPALAE